MNGPKKKFRVGIFGGTFDPVTPAHKWIVDAVVERKILDQLIIVPTVVSCHRHADDVMFSRSDRLEMVRKYLPGTHDKVSFSAAEYYLADLHGEDSEIVKSRRFYETLVDIKGRYIEKYGAAGYDVEFYTIVGSDEYAKIRRGEWFNSVGICANTKFIVIDGRCGSESPVIPGTPGNESVAEVIQVPKALANISASQIRNDIRSGLFTADAYKESLTSVSNVLNLLYRSESGEYGFNPHKAISEIIEQLNVYLADNGLPRRLVVGISGGIDSAVVAAIAKETVGAKNVYGVMMPNGDQKDIDDANRLVSFLGINKMVVNIQTAFDDIVNSVQRSRSDGLSVSEQTRVNLPPRLRMATLYAIAQSVDGIVLNTCNVSESVVGYDTLFGDDCGSYAPIQALTKTEVRCIARSYNIPANLIEKAPADGLQESSDEDRLGFTYADLDRYIRLGICPDAEVKAMIDAKYKANKFKMDMIRLPGPKFAEFANHVVTK